MSVSQIKVLLARLIGPGGYRSRHYDKLNALIAAKFCHLDKEFFIVLLDHVLIPFPDSDLIFPFSGFHADKSIPVNGLIFRVKCRHPVVLIIIGGFRIKICGYVTELRPVKIPRGDPGAKIHLPHLVKKVLQLLLRRAHLIEHVGVGRIYLLGSQPISRIKFVDDPIRLLVNTCILKQVIAVDRELFTLRSVERSPSGKTREMSRIDICPCMGRPENQVVELHRLQHMHLQPCERIGYEQVVHHHIKDNDHGYEDGGHCNRYEIFPGFTLCILHRYTSVKYVS